jgi:hypothetical protein
LTKFRISTRQTSFLIAYAFPGIGSGGERFRFMNQSNERARETTLCPELPHPGVRILHGRAGQRFSYE